MTQVATVNVLLGSNKQSMLAYLDGLNSPSPKNNFSDIVFFSNKGNANFISFEHNFLGENPKMVLKFIDPQGEFETSYLSTGSIYSSLVQIANKLSFDVTSDPKDSKESTSALPKTKKEYVNLLTSKSLYRPIYIMYGSGDDPTAWSDVHRVVVHGLSFEPDKGREFTMVMQGLEKNLNPINKVTMEGTSINVNKFYSVEARGQSSPIDFDSDNAYSAPNSEFTPIDYHLLITDTISDYLKKCSNGANVIVLLPDMNKVLGDRIAQSKLDTGQGISRAGQLRDQVRSILSEIGIDILVQFDHKYIPDNIPGQLSPLLEQKGKQTKNLTDEFYFKIYQHKAEIKSNSFGLREDDFITPLKTIVRAANIQGIKTYVIDPIAYSETNVLLNDFWGAEKNKSRYLFNGYDPFDSNKPTLVFGDDGMINTLLMPREGQEAFPKELIHPFIADDLLRTEYTQEVKKLATDLREGSSFGDISYVPDVFQYTDNVLTEEEIKLVQKNNIPVLRHNTKNPNVLSIKQNDDSPAYLAEMNFAFKKQQNRVAALVAEGGKVVTRISDFPITTPEELKEAIATAMYSNYGPIITREEIISSIIDRVPKNSDSNKLLFPRIAEISRNQDNPENSILSEIEGYISYFIDALSDRKCLDLLIPQEINADPALILNQIANQLSKKVTTLRVSTLPLYAISSYTQFLGSPILVFSQDPPMQGQVYPRRSQLNSYLTGTYRIIGFKHVLSDTKAETEFILAKAKFQSPLPELMRGEDLESESQPYMIGTEGKSKDGTNNFFPLDGVSLEIPGPEEFVVITESNDLRDKKNTVLNENFNKSRENVDGYNYGTVSFDELSEIDIMILIAEGSLPEEALTSRRLSNANAAANKKLFSNQPLDFFYNIQLPQIFPTLFPYNPDFWEKYDNMNPVESFTGILDVNTGSGPRDN